MMKRMLALAFWSLLIASGAQAQSIWSGRFAYENNAATAYPPNEFSLDLFGDYATRDKSGHSGDAWGLGLGANYFFTRNLGIGADTYADAFQVPYLLNGSVIYRYPLMETGLAPYGFRKRMQTGEPTSMLLPVGESRPVTWLILSTTMLPLSALATSRKLPVGSMLKLRGVVPSVG